MSYDALPKWLVRHGWFVLEVEVSSQQSEHYSARLAGRKGIQFFKKEMVRYDHCDVGSVFAHIA